MPNIQNFFLSSKQRKSDEGKVDRPDDAKKSKVDAAGDA